VRPDILQPGPLRSPDQFPSTIWMRIEMVKDSTAESRAALAAMPGGLEGL
jgi:hypothetical protein